MKKEIKYTNKADWSEPSLRSRDNSCTWLGPFIRRDSNKVADVNIIGIPFDMAVNYRPGSRFAPAEIRKALSSSTTYVSDRRYDFSNLIINDVGDIDVVNHLQETYSRIESVVTDLSRYGTLVILGGDHSITRSCITGVLNGRLSGSGRMGLIIFDTHYDYRDSVEGKEHSGNWLKQVLDDNPGRLTGCNTALLGISAGSYSPEYQQKIDSKNILCYTVSELRQKGIDKLIDEVMAQVCPHTTGIYISLDIDVIHQVYAPGTSVPNPNGLSPGFVMDCLYVLAQKANVLCIDITEVNPLVDIQSFTSHVAAQFVLQYLVGKALRKVNEEEK